MSELTECNYCSLKDMKRRAAARGVEVITEQGRSNMVGWISARYSDQDEPSAYFAQLTSECVC